MSLRITYCSGGHPPGYRLFDVSITRFKSIKVVRHFVVRLYNLNTSRVAMASTQIGSSRVVLSIGVWNLLAIKTR